MLARTVALVACGGCGRLDFAPLDRGDAIPNLVDAPSDASGTHPLHLYRFAGNLDDDYNGPSLVSSGSTTINASNATFTVGSGFTVVGAVPQQLYTIDMTFSFDQLTSWRKIIDFDNYAKDSGFYTYESAIQQVITPGTDFLTSAPNLTVDTQIRVTLVRDANGKTSAYLNGALIAATRGGETPPTNPTATFVFDDSVVQTAEFSSTFASWFVDDTVTSQDEAASGTVYQIAIWDTALDATQVAAW